MNKKYILIVEDDQVSLLYFEEIITNMEFADMEVHIDHVDTGEKAVDYCNIHPVDLILMDIKLPGMNGWESTQKIKAIHPNITVITQSAYISPGGYQKSMVAGCADHLLKPVSIDKLRNTLHKYL